VGEERTKAAFQKFFDLIGTERAHGYRAAVLGIQIPQ